MRIYILLLLIFKFSNITSQSKVDLAINSLVEYSNFEWSIAGNIQGNSPNVLSELQFKDIVVIGGNIEASYEFINKIYFNVLYQLGSVTRGKGVDTDYEEDDYQGITFNENFQSNDGNSKTYKMGLKYFPIHNRNFKLGAGLHYLNSSRKFTLLSPDLEDLNSSYNLDLEGFQFSLNPIYKINNLFKLNALISYSRLSYRANANWNLIEIFQHPISFIHVSNADMKEYQLGVIYDFNKHISLQSTGTWGTTKVLEGLDKSFLKNGSEIRTQFNGGSLESLSLNFGILCRL